MARTYLNPGCMLAPLPAVLVSCAGKDGRSNLITIAWTGILNSDPPMCYISVRKERFSHDLIRESGEFVINLTTKEMAKGTDLCGVRSGKDTDKWALSGFTPEKAQTVKAPLVRESPVCLECKVREIRELGSHDMFVADITAVAVDDRYMDEKGRFDLNAPGLMAYTHGSYVETGKVLGTFGYSVRKKKK